MDSYNTAQQRKASTARVTQCQIAKPEYGHCKHLSPAPPPASGPAAATCLASPVIPSPAAAAMPAAAAHAAAAVPAGAARSPASAA
jgi:hypothetical protein